MERSTERRGDSSGSDRSRRQFVAGAGLTAAVGLAGCSGILSGGGGGPKAAIRDYVSAVNEADDEVANGLLHPEGDARELSERELTVFEQAELSVESMEVLEETEGRADVEGTLSISGGGLDETTTGQWEVQTHEGEWRIYAQAMG